MLKLVAKNGGVVMVNFYSGFIVPEGGPGDAETHVRGGPRAEDEVPERGGVPGGAARSGRKDNPIPRGDVHDVVDHIEHIIKVAGIDHVGLGSDFDGIDRRAEQLEDVSCYPYITQELLNRGYKKEQILKVLGANLMRVFRDVEKARGSEQ